MEGICGLEGELKQYFDALDKVRTVVDKLDTNIEIPQIAVIGNQSVGKSSVLELISGVRLPQGNDIVTRCPIMLQIRRAAKSNIEINGERFGKSQLAAKLNAAQDRVIEQYCSKARNEVTAKPVILNMCGPDLRDLTLVDLPGIQYSEDDLKDSIVTMIETYISSDATIILLVNNCTSDPTATEALALARKHDPKQIRTVFILTKPDEIKNDDTEKKEALMKLVKGQHAQLNFACGTFIVKGRQSNHSDLTIEQVRDLEAEYFQSQCIFDTCWEMGKAGSIKLTKAIEQLALTKMKNALPNIRKELLKTVKKKKDDFQAFPLDTLPLGNNRKLRIVTHSINDIYLEYNRSIENELGQRVKLLFEMMQVKILNLLRNESKKDEIIEDIMNCGSLNPHGFASTEKFKLLFQMNLKQVVAVAESTIYDVQDEVELLVEHIVTKKGKTLDLDHEFASVANDVFRSNMRDLIKLYKDLIEAEMMPYLPDFMEFFFEGEKQLASIPLAFTLHGNLPGYSEVAESLVTTAVEAKRSPSVSSSNINENEMEETPIEKTPEQPKAEQSDKSETLKKEEKKKKSFLKFKKDKDFKEAILKLYSDDTSPANPKIKKVKNLNIDDVTSSFQDNEQIREAKSKKYSEGKLVYDAYRTYLYHTSVTLLMTVPKIICHHLFVRFPDDLQKTLLSMITEFSQSMTENTDAQVRYDNLKEDIAKLDDILQELRKFITKPC